MYRELADYFLAQFSTGVIVVDTDNNNNIVCSVGHDCDFPLITGVKHSNMSLAA